MRARSAAAAIAWYNPESWFKVKAVAEDPERFEATFEEWLIRAKRQLKTMEADGVRAIAVPVARWTSSAASQRAFPIKTSAKRWG